MSYDVDILAGNRRAIFWASGAMNDGFRPRMQVYNWLTDHYIEVDQWEFEQITKSIAHKDIMNSKHPVDDNNRAVMGLRFKFYNKAAAVAFKAKWG